MTATFSRLFALLTLLALAACGAPSDVTPDTEATMPGYEQIEDGGFVIKQVDQKFLWGDQARAEVDYAGTEAPGSIVVDTFARKLYFVMEGGRAMRYSIAVGREGIKFTGEGVVGRKAEWPNWQPTANMLTTRPDLYSKFAAGLPGGLENPLGARGIYLYRGGRDSYFRIHGTIDDASIGYATSAGCIRLFNQDVIDLYERVEMGALVKVRSLEESLAAEGAFIDTPYGRAIPDSEDNRQLVEDQRVEKVAQDVAEIEALLKEKEEAEAAAEAEAKVAAKDAEKAAKKAAAEAEKQAAEADKAAATATKAADKTAKAAVAEAAKAAKAAEKAAMAAEKAAAKAAKALAKRLAECEALGILPDDCPAPDQPLPDLAAAN